MKDSELEGLVSVLKEVVEESPRSTTANSRLNMNEQQLDSALFAYGDTLTSYILPDQTPGSAAIGVRGIVMSSTMEPMHNDARYLSITGSTGIGNSVTNESI